MGEKEEMENEGTGKGKKMEGRERVIRYPTFGQSDANGLALPPNVLEK